MKNKTNKNKKINRSIMLGSMLGISAILIPTCVVACGAQTNSSSGSSGSSSGQNNDNNNNSNNDINSLQQIANEAIAKVSLLNTISIAQTFPSQITNLDQWFSFPASPNFNWSLVQGTQNNPNPNNFTGQISLQLEATDPTLYPGVTAQATRTFSGFLSYQEQANNLAKAVSITAKTNINTVYPIQINSSNISNYLNITPLPSNSNLSYIYIFNDASSTTSSGTLNLNIEVQNSNTDPNTFSVIKSIESQLFSFSGFKQGIVSTGAVMGPGSGKSPALENFTNNLIVVIPKDYSIVQYMNSAISGGWNGAISGNNLPTSGQIGDALILEQGSNTDWSSSYFTWTTQNANSSVSLNSGNDTSLSFRIWENGSNTNFADIVVNGFTSANQYLTPILNSQTITVNSTGKTQLPVTVANSTNISTYLNLPTAPAGVSSLQVILSPNSSVNNANGSLQVTLQATIYGVAISSSPITVTGFQTTTQFTAQSIANNLINSMPQNVSLSEFTNNAPINFTLADIPSWFNISEANMNILKTLIGSISLSDVQINIALPTYDSNPAVGDLSSNTSSKITVTINGESATGILTNFQSAQNYFATSGIINATIANASQYTNLNGLWTAIQKAGLTKDGETINANGSTTNSDGTLASDQSIFDITLNSKNIFNWTNSSLNYVTCAMVGNTITLRIFINGNVWFDVNFTASDIPTSVVKPTEPAVPVSSITKE